MIAISRKEQIEYVLQEEREAADKTTFLLRPLARLQRVEIEDMISSAKESIPMGTFTQKLMKHGLAGWMNLKGADGKDISYKAGRDGLVKDEQIELFTFAQRIELSNEIWKLSSVGEEDVKN